MTYSTRHPHAVDNYNGNSYGYDLNGNQTTRVIGEDTFTLFYDAENHLVEVKKNDASFASFTYYGDGKRAQSTINGVSTTFVGNYYEVSGSAVTKYYYAGSSRVAMREDGELYFLLGDHLGSTSLTTDSQGSVISEMRYTAWGSVRHQSGSTQSDYTFTGQYSDAALNLLWYGSRHYDPELGRFIQADSIVPTASQGVQALDRYAYANNSPVLYNDPTGHCAGPFAIVCIGAALVGLTVAMSQVPSDVPQADPADWGNEYVFAAGLSAIPAFDFIISTWQCATSGCDPVTYLMTSLPGPNPKTVANAVDDVADEVIPAQTTAIVPYKNNTAIAPYSANTAMVPYYPPNIGAAGDILEVTAPKGQILSRYGGLNGTFFSPQGTPLAARSLPYGAEKFPEHLYMVNNPFTYYVSQAASWFGKPGGGIQYKTIQSVKWLLDNDYLVDYP